MNIQPLLDDWQIPRIRRIESAETRSYVEHAIPGRASNLLQDLNTRPLRLYIEGSLFGDESRDDFLTTVRAKFQAGEPVTFVADILTATSVQYVIIEQLRLVESGDVPDEISYFILLRESPPPPPPPDPLGGIDTSLLDQAGDFMDSVTGALDALEALGNVPDFGDPTPPLQDALGGVSGTLDGLDLSALTAIFGD